MDYQHTIRNKISCIGTGLHTGKAIKLIISPAPVNSGITFVRLDLPGCPQLAAQYDQVFQTELATTLGRAPLCVSTIEHLMGALFIMGVDNAQVAVDGPEIPIMDGSAKTFVTLIRKAGLKEQKSARRVMVITKTVTVRDGDKFATMAPGAPVISYAISFPNTLIGDQKVEIPLERDALIAQVAAARTFGFLRDVEYLKAKGLALGGGLENAVVFDNAKILNSDGLRFTDECVRHKVLDAIGDFSLLGMPILGQITIYKGGHALHSKLLHELVASQSYRIVDKVSADILPPPHFRPVLTFA